jgi:uncharacterized protein YceK
MKTRIKLILVVLVISGCSSIPPVDPKQTNMAQYERDFEYCEYIASQHAGVEQSASAGLLVGAGLMAAGSAILGGDVTQWAALGGMTGAAHGAGHGYLKKDSIIRDCLTNRGYQILGK